MLTALLFACAPVGDVRAAGDTEPPLVWEPIRRTVPPDYAALAAALEVPDGFTVTVEPPWIVIGDGPPAEVRRRATGTVRWATRKLRAQFFAADPSPVYEIWLLDGDESYRRLARERFGDDPDTPYGYASDEDHALVMNIATGGGTLVHEMVHPFMATNVADCPAWLNEGLASLFEHSAERDGRIVGRTNWRLPSLQEAIRAGDLRPFRWLTSRDAGQFYRDDPGTNYAQARYLLYHLQEKGLLEEYFRLFLAARAADPTGYETLRGILGDPDMDAFQAEWEEWVLGLRQGA